MIQGFTLVHLNGKIEKIYRGNFTATDLEFFENSEENTKVITMLPAAPTDYYDFSLDVFVGIGNQPSPDSVFDYETKKWVDNRTLEDAKGQKWEEIKSQRDQLEFGGFEFDGNIYDSDQVSQGRIIGAAIAGVDQVWTLADNTTVELSASQLQQLYAALQAHIASVHERGRIARQLIFDAKTKEEVEEINL